MKKLINQHVKLGHIFAILLILFIGAAVATNYTSQQIDNFLMTMTPDTSQAARLAPDNINWFHYDTLNATDTIHLWRMIGTINKQFNSRYKFSITPYTQGIYLKVCGPCTDSVPISPGQTYTSDYLHPLYDSTIYLRDSASGQGTYKIGIQGR